MQRYIIQTDFKRRFFTQYIIKGLAMENIRIRRYRNCSVGYPYMLMK